MKTRTLVTRSLRFHARAGLAVLAGCAISAAVLVGALFVGDSVRASLERIALARLGRVQVALDAGPRRFRADLALRLHEKLGSEVAAALRVRGMAIREAPDGATHHQVNRVQVLGVDDAFFGLAATHPGITLGPGQVALSETLAAALGANVGDEIALRVARPDLLSREAPLASRARVRTPRRLVTVTAVLTDDQLGRFGLASDQASPRNAFVNLAWLQETLELGREANLLVAGETSAPAANAALRQAFTLEDAGLVVEAAAAAATGVVQLRSPRIYLDPAVASAALGASPTAAGAISYLVNSITAASGRTTPYSFMTAVAPTGDRALGPVPLGMEDTEIVVNRWLADQLAIGPGDRVDVAYFALTAGGTFVERSRPFTVGRIVEMAALEPERARVPRFPGLTDVDACANWDVGITTDAAKLRDPPNEAYWKRYRQTPKAFVTLAAGRAMWGNRYGDLMAVRYRAEETDAGRLTEQLRNRIDPAQVGLSFRSVRALAIRAASESMDLGGLFLGMSFFLIAASLLLTAMLFVFSIERRAPEMGVLRAVGLSPGQVRRIFLAEGCLIAGLGSLAGLPLGWVYAQGLVRGLLTAWSGAVAGTSIEFHATGASAAIGVGAATVVSLLAMALTLRRQGRQPVRELLSGDAAGPARAADGCGGGTGGRRHWLRGAIAVAGTAGAAGVTGWTLLSGAGQPAGFFFAAGALMLIGGIAGVRIVLARVARGSAGRLTARGLGIRNAGRRPGRGMATAGILASGCFIVFAVAAMKEDHGARAGERAGATGGFELYGESSVAVSRDLNEPEGRAAFRLDDRARLQGVHVLPIRVHDGDDASCLNLNQAQNPPLLGVDPEALARLGAFAAPGRAADLWGLLDRKYPPDVVPALVGDSATAVWKLKKTVDPVDGDLLDYTDERGTRFRVKLVGALPMRLSVLQGRLLIADRAFARRYPSEAGHRMFLVDTPAGQEAAVQRYLGQRLESVGLDLVPAVARLGEFYAVESTYLMMFLVLGGLGLLLGTAGMGILVLRSVMERRGELAVLRAVGLSPRLASRVVMAEHRFLLAAGLITGTAAAALAILPSAARPGVHVPFGLLALFLAGTVVLSLAWIALATRLALRSPLVPALRDDR